MSSFDSKKKKYNPGQQLDLIRLKCKSLSPEIYRLNALYIQIVRNNLFDVVRNSIINLIMLNDNNISLFDIEDDRSSMKGNIENIVVKFSSKLTIEHLISLAIKLEEERGKEIKKVEDSFLNALSANNLEADKSETSDLNSVELNLSLPIENNLNLERWNEPNQKPIPQTFELEPKISFSISSYKTSHHKKSNLNSEDELANNDKQDSDKNNIKDIDFLKSIFKMAKGAISPGSNSLDPEIVNSTTQDEEAHIKESFEGFLPETPLKLYHWSNSIDFALTRSLRDLSHLINLELLKSGLINSFVPTNLLEAIISGQITSLNTSSNLVRLELPVNEKITDEHILVSCLLIRTSELEYDSLKLRKCRSQISQQRNLLTKLIRQQRYWESKSVVSEISEEWLQNPLKMSPFKKPKSK